jgi:hypothetical protein
MVPRENGARDRRSRVMAIVIVTAAAPIARDDRMPARGARDRSRRSDDARSENHARAITLCLTSVFSQP